MTRINVHHSNASQIPTWYFGSKYMGNVGPCSLVKMDLSDLFNKAPLNKPDSIKEES